MPSPSHAAVTAALLALALPFSASAQDDGIDGVRPGDRVTLDFYTASGQQPPEIPGDRIVDRNGNIFLPFVGTVEVNGRTADEIQQLLRVRYEPFFADPVVTVNTEYAINVTGAVGAPGHYFMDPTSTIVDALAIAGGSGLEVAAPSLVAADASRVRLVRRTGEIVILDVRPDHVDRRALTMHVQSGDWIYVPPQQQSNLREDIQVWAGVVSIAASVTWLVYLISGN